MLCGARTLVSCSNGIRIALLVHRGFVSIASLVLGLRKLAASTPGARNVLRRAGRDGRMHFRRSKRVVRIRIFRRCTKAEQRPDSSNCSILRSKPQRGCRGGYFREMWSASQLLPVIATMIPACTERETTLRSSGIGEPT